MSDNDNEEETVKKRGQSRKSEGELRAAFAASGVQGLLDVDNKGRCKVCRVEGDKIETLIGPASGNTMLRYLEGATKLGPYLKTAQ